MTIRANQTLTMKKRAKHTEYFWPPIHKQSSNGVWILFSLIGLVMFGAAIFVSDVESPEHLSSVSGVVEKREPIYSRDKRLTGFHFCVGQPCVPFTYAQPDPRVEETLEIVKRAASITVLYAAPPNRRPKLWGIAADGQTLATTEELRDARSWNLMLWVLGFVASGVAGLHFILRAVRERRHRKARR